LPDIKNHKNKTAIKYLYDNKIISGYPDGFFRPDNTVTRAELLKILIEGKGESPSLEYYNNCFSDVQSQWYSAYICYAKAEDWISGYSDDSFKPGYAVSKIEAIKILMESQGYILPAEVIQNPYSDVNKNEWYAKYIELAKEKGLLEETGQYFGLQDKMSRASISENIYRTLMIKENGYNKYPVNYEENYASTNNNSSCQSVNEEFYPNIDIKKIRESWLTWYNEARSETGKHNYKYNNQLNRTANAWSRHFVLQSKVLTSFF